MTTYTSSAAVPTAASPTTSWSSTRPLAGLLFFVLSAGFMILIMLAASIAPSYDYAGGAISDLGRIDETALLFNVGLLLVGLLNIIGGYAFYRTHRRGWLLAIYALAGAGAIGAGAIPLGTSDLHSIFALLAFVFFNAEAVGTGYVLHGPMRPISWLAGGAGMAYVVIMVIGDSGNPGIFGAIGHGGAERLIVYPVMLWMTAMGGYLMAGAPAKGSRDEG